MIDKITNDSKRRSITFFIIIIQSIGIRFFEGQGIILSVLILLLSWEGVKYIRRSDVKALLIILFFLVINKTLNTNFTMSAWTYQVSLVLSTYVFLLQYRNPLHQRHLFSEFYSSLKWFSFHALIGYFVYLAVPNMFQQIFLNKTLFGIFYVSKSNFGSLTRNTGLGWEPGTTQLIANLFLFFSIKFRKKLYYLAIIAVCVVSTFSTTGLLLLVLNILYYFLVNLKKMNPVFLVVSLLMAIALVLPIVISNSTDKLNGDNTSGLVRQRDILIGFSLMEEKPLLGHGLFDVKYLATKKYAIQIEDSLFSSEYLEDSGLLGGGYTNGLLGLFCWYGIPVGLIAFWLFYKNKFVSAKTYEKIIFFVIFCFSALSEPITYTSLFLMFPFSYLIFKNNKRKRLPSAKLLRDDLQDVNKVSTFSV